MTRQDAQFLIVGGGFFGCCLALFLRSVTDRVVLLEADARPMQRASLVNQARIHTGFHYPRSVLTAFRSMVLSQRFAKDFPDAVKRDFRMLYAISGRRSKVSAQRFLRFFTEMGAPIREASRQDAGLFDDRMVEAVFECSEWAFDSRVLAEDLGRRMQSADLDIRCNTRVERLREESDRVVAELSDGREISADHVFNVTYSEVNNLLRLSGLPEIDLRIELAELVMIDRPEPLRDIGITVMDGAFFSAMPYPARDCYSLSHVRYTPQVSWRTKDNPVSPYAALVSAPRRSYARQMIADASRFLPCMAGTVTRGSSFEAKAIPMSSENNDSRPILFHKGRPDSLVTTVLGGKIDNIYDLFSAVRASHPSCTSAHDGLITGRTAG